MATDNKRAQQLLKRADRLERLSVSATIDQLALAATFNPEEVEDVDGFADITDSLCDRLSDVDGREQFQLADGPRVEAWARILGRHGLEGLRKRQEPTALGAAPIPPFNR